MQFSHIATGVSTLQAAAPAVALHDYLHASNQLTMQIATASPNQPTQKATRDLDLSWLPYAAQQYHVSNDLRDYVVVPVVTIVSDVPNVNGDNFQVDELTRFDVEVNRFMYQTFLGKGTYLEHRDNLVLPAAKGLIFDTYLTPLDSRYQGKRVKLHKLLGFDMTKDRSLAQAILRREINSFSMGARYLKYQCSITGRVLPAVPPDFKLPLGAKEDDFFSPYTRIGVPTTKLPNGKLAYRNLLDARGVETSAVSTPAYPVAYSDDFLDLSQTQVAFS